MPLISPEQVRAVFKEERKTQLKNGKVDLNSLLSQNGLTPEDILFNLNKEMLSADQASVRLAAAKIGLQLNGLLDQDSKGQDFNVTIVINDSEFSSKGNPILIPRDLVS